MTQAEIQKMREQLISRQSPSSQPSFSSNPYAEEQAKLEAQLGIGQPQVGTPVQQAQVSTAGKIGQGVTQGLRQSGQSAIGVGKGILNTINNISQLGQKAMQKITGVQSPTASLPSAATTPTAAQKPAFVGEQIGEFFTPSNITNKLTKTLDIAAEGAKLGKVGQVAAKAVGRAALEGSAAATVRLGQTASGKEAAKAGATAGVVSGGVSAVGDALRAARVPEWFYSKIFRTSADDMLQELKTVGTANLQKTNPELYNKLVGSGVIKVDKAGKTILNETLAKEALDRGLKGSIKNMANVVVKDTYELEDAAQRLTVNHSTPIKVEPQYEKILQNVAAEYRDVGFGEVSKEANDILAKIKNGSTDANNALRLRRFLDGMRLRFNPEAKLSTSQQNFKTLADHLRSRLATEVPGLKPVMNEYRFNIDALEGLAKEAARRGNREVIGLLDTVFFGSGIASGNPAAGATLGVARRVINSPAGTTRIGQTLNSLGKGTSKTGALIRGGAAYLNSKGGQSTPSN